MELEKASGKGPKDRLLNSRGVARNSWVLRTEL